MNRPPDFARLVHARDLTVRFVSRDATVYAVNGVDFDLGQNETLCTLGESGSGKSVTLRAMMRLNPRRRTLMGGTLLVSRLSIAVQELMLRRLCRVRRGPV